MSGISPYVTPQEVASRGTQTGTVSSETVELLRRTKGWVLLIGVVTLIGSALLVIGGGLVILGSVLGSFSSFSEVVATDGLAIIATGVVFFCMSLFSIMSSVRLIQYSTAIKALNVSFSEADLNLALNAQRSFWKISGLFVALVLIFYILLFIIGICIGVASFIGS